jgi:Ig-like domain from next to BRCA1 gene
MKNLARISWLLIAFILLALSACGGGSAAATPTGDTASIYTQIASTALALQTQTALAVPTATNTPQASPTLKATNTPLITDTPLPGTPSATPLTLKTPKITSQASCDNFDPNIIDVTIADNTEILPGDSFIKTWRFKNLGPCTWNEDYKLIYSYGNVNGDTDWSKVRPVNFPNLVVPGDTVEISITLTAPSEAGTYRGVFRLQNDKGFNFGIEFWVQIVVK